tara:strand:- start:8266 stop:8850 length:585 start_codon:yes stop_codon:yes gene_type:complete
MIKLITFLFSCLPLFSIGQVSEFVYIDPANLDDVGGLNEVYDRSSQLLDELTRENKHYVVFVNNVLRTENNTTYPVIFDDQVNYSRSLKDAILNDPDLLVTNRAIDAVVSYLDSSQISEDISFHIFSSLTDLSGSQDHKNVVVNRLVQILSQANFENQKTEANISVYLYTKDIELDSLAYLDLVKMAYYNLIKY